MATPQKVKAPMRRGSKALLRKLLRMPTRTVRKG